MAEGGLLLRWWLCARRRWHRRRRRARLVLWGGGEARCAEPGTAAGEIMVDHPGRVVCRADGFRIGRPVPVLDIEDRLDAGRTYLVIPVDRLPCAGVLTAASLAALSHSAAGNGKPSSSAAASLAGGGRSPFEYGKDEDGRTVIRVTEEFMVRAVTACGGGGGKDGGGGGGALCSTPELRKDYEQLVGAARGRAWSPRLDTIKERKGRRRLVDVVSPGRLSPVRLLGIDKGLR